MPVASSRTLFSTCLHGRRFRAGPLVRPLQQGWHTRVTRVTQKLRGGVVLKEHHIISPLKNISQKKCATCSASFLFTR